MFPIQVGIMVAGIVIMAEGLIDVMKLEFLKKPIGRVAFGVFFFLLAIALMAYEAYLS